MACQIRRPMSDVNMRRRQIVALLSLTLLLTGCGTRFKYQPSHAQSYRTIADNRGIAIIRGEDLRIDTTHPDWSPEVPTIVADALADELKHNRVFQRVKVRRSLPGTSNRDFSHLVTFHIQEFEYHDESNTLESLGRVALRSKGDAGPWIARSIPAKYVANVQVQFDVIDPRTRKTIFTKSYAARETVRANDYQSDSPQIRATSVALEKVITRFATDLVSLSPGR